MSTIIAHLLILHFIKILQFFYYIRKIKHKLLKQNKGECSDNHLWEGDWSAGAKNVKLIENINI